MSNFGSYVKALRKASTHLTEEPYLLVERDRWRSDIVLVSYLVNTRDDGRVACKQMGTWDWLQDNGRSVLYLLDTALRRIYMGEKL